MNDLPNLILRGEYPAASEIARGMTTSDLENVLMTIAYDQVNLATYSFVCYLLALHETSELHELASLLMIHPLCHMGHLDSAYAVALYHVKRAIALNPADLSLKEYLFFFHLVPDRLVSEEEAVRCAREILTIDPGNKAAQNFFETKGWETIGETGMKVSEHLEAPMLTVGFFDADVFEMELYVRGERRARHVMRLGTDFYDREPGHGETEAWILTLALDVREADWEEALQLEEVDDQTYRLEKILQASLWQKSDWFDELDETIKGNFVVL
jgi:hypothetical protein